MRIASETGGGLAETLEQTAATLRSQYAIELKIKALTSQGKMQAWVVGLMPVFLLWVLTRMEPEAMALPPDRHRQARTTLYLWHNKLLVCH